MEGMETLRRREDLREKVQKKKRKRWGESEAGRKQHVSVGTMWYRNLLHR